MIVSEITLFNTLKMKLGETEAQVVVEGIKGAVKEEFDNKKELLATKEDIANLRGELKSEMANAKTEMIKWMFIFWIGQLASFIAISKLFFHQ